MKARSASNRRRSTNGYADLGNRASESMLVKAQLVSRIAELIAERGMTPIEAATLLNVPELKLSKILRGQFGGFSLYELLKCFTHLGYDVHIVIRPRPDKRSTGTLSVTFA
jgi:predicted XRE-type DNA-binding protein